MWYSIHKVKPDGTNGKCYFTSGTHETMDSQPCLALLCRKVRYAKEDNKPFLEKGTRVRVWVKVRWNNGHMMGYYRWNPELPGIVNKLFSFVSLDYQPEDKNYLVYTFEVNIRNPVQDAHYIVLLCYLFRQIHYLGTEGSNALVKCISDGHKSSLSLFILALMSRCTNHLSGDKCINKTPGSIAHIVKLLLRQKPLPLNACNEYWTTMLIRKETQNRTDDVSPLIKSALPTNLSNAIKYAAPIMKMHQTIVKQPPTIDDWRQFI